MVKKRGLYHLSIKSHIHISIYIVFWALFWLIQTLLYYLCIKYHLHIYSLIYPCFIKPIIYISSSAPGVLLKVVIILFIYSDKLTIKKAYTSSFLAYISIYIISMLLYSIYYVRSLKQLYCKFINYRSMLLDIFYCLKFLIIYNYSHNICNTNS